MYLIRQHGHAVVMYLNPQDNYAAVVSNYAGE